MKLTIAFLLASLTLDDARLSSNDDFAAGSRRLEGHPSPGGRPDAKASAEVGEAGIKNRN